MKKKHPISLLPTYTFYYQLEVRDHCYVMVLYDENYIEVDAEYFDEGSLRLIWNDTDTEPPITYPFNTLLKYLRRANCQWMKYLREKYTSGKSEMFYVGLFREIWTDRIDELLEENRRTLDVNMSDAAADKEERRQLAEFFEADLIHFKDLNSEKIKEEP